MHRKSSVFLTLAGVLACMVLAVPAGAQAGRPCSETIKQYCSDVVPGGGRIMKCLNEHQEAQSIACKDWVADQQKSLEELKSACGEEIALLCRIDPSSGINLFFCLNDNYTGLKTACRQKVREIKERLQ